MLVLTWDSGDGGVHEKSQTRTEEYFEGSIRGSKLTVLADDGSQDNVVHPRMVQRLGSKTKPCCNHV